MSETTTNAAPLTVALVHGAFADASLRAMSDEGLSRWNGSSNPAGQRVPGDGTRDPAARHRS